MKSVSLRLNYTRQRLYRNILVELGLVHPQDRYNSNVLEVLMTPNDFVNFVAQALADTKAVFSLRSMEFRLVDAAKKEMKQKEEPAQRDLFEITDSGVAIEKMLTSLFGVPVVMIDDFSKLEAKMAKALKEESAPCQCPACSLGMTLEEALRQNYRETSTVTGVGPINTKAEQVLEKPSDGEINDLHEKALAWDKKMNSAIELAVDFFYDRITPDVSAWRLWHFLEEHQGRRMVWTQFQPKKEFRSMQLGDIFTQAQAFRARILDILP